MPDKPLLILPRSAPLPRVKQQRAMKSYLRLPGRGDQGERIGPQLTSMIDAFVSDSPAGISSENILVLETVDRPENFRTAVSAVPGLKWLAEIDTDDTGGTGSDRAKQLPVKGLNPNEGCFLALKSCF